MSLFAESILHTKEPVESIRENLILAMLSLKKKELTADELAKNEAYLRELIPENDRPEIIDAAGVIEILSDIYQALNKE